MTSCPSDFAPGLVVVGGALPVVTRHTRHGDRRGENERGSGTHTTHSLRHLLAPRTPRRRWLRSRLTAIPRFTTMCHADSVWKLESTVLSFHILSHNTPCVKSILQKLIHSRFDMSAVRFAFKFFHDRSHELTLFLFVRIL